MTAKVKTDNRRVIVGAVRRAAEQALREVCEDALTEANDRVPLDEGDLARSGEVVVRGLVGAITYDTPYAVRQHEDPSLRHPRQGEPYWLERTVDDNAARYFQHIADAMRSATK